MILSIVVPCYNEEKTIILFYNEFIKIFNHQIKKITPIWNMNLF